MFAILNAVSSPMAYKNLQADKVVAIFVIV